MRGSLLSMLPSSLFSRPPSDEGCVERLGPLSPVMVTEEGDRKRQREVGEFVCVGGSRNCSRTPTLLSTSCQVSASDDETERPAKRFRGERTSTFLTAAVVSKPQPFVPQPQQSQFLRVIPDDVVSHCLSFLGTVEDRFALQNTCKQFRRISNSAEMLVNVRVGGDRETGKNGIIQDDDTPQSAANALAPFAEAGNLEATYMLGMIKSYCHQDVEKGIQLLKDASSRGFVRSSYALGLVLRDSNPEDATEYMKLAADNDYLPALQELLPAREMKAKFGEPNADELRRHLDPLCLNRLLGRYYVHSAELRELNTSHCWNPLCGRWAFKATVNTNAVTVRVRRPWGNPFYRPGEAYLVPGRGNFPAQNGQQIIGVSDGSGTSDSEALSRNGTTNISGRTGNQVARIQPPAIGPSLDVRVSRMKMCSRCCRAKYCSKLCQVYDWRSGRHKMECQFL